MKNVLIALVLVLTALTFYSALWFKSETIEDDITARVTDELNAVGANNIDIGVDGRHVTLTGVVYDETVEDNYLDTADATYGALGPIDGLTFQADGGYLSAIKTAEGISLKGTVPNEDVRAALVANAQAATDGTVDDQLMVAGPEAEWQDEAAFGVSQLAGLTTGALTAAAGAYSLSGMTDANPDAVSAGLVERDGWQAFISSPAAEQNLSGEVARLTGQAALLGTNLSNAEAQIATLTGERDAAIAERDDVSDELAELRAGLTEGETNAAELRAQLSASEENLEGATAMIAEKDQTIADLNEGVAALQTSNSELMAEIDRRGRRVTGADALVAALSTNVSDRDGRISELEAELANRQNALGDTGEQVAQLEGRVTGLEADLDSATALAAERGATIVELTNTVAERDETIASLQVQTTSNLDDTNARIAELTDDVAQRDSRIDALSASVTTRDATIRTLRQEAEQVDDLTAELADANGEVARLNGVALTAQSAANRAEAQVAELTADVAARDSRIDALSASVMTRDETIRTLRPQAEQVDGLTAALADANAEAARAQGQVSSLDNRVAALSASVLTRDDTIRALRNRPAPEPVVVEVPVEVQADVAEQCTAAASAAIEGSRINFDTATARINQDSVELLERMTGIALACVGEGITVEVGGHTDAQGSDENNQVLSEARAQAVVAFMAERGVPTSGLTAVGYGESQPIADNETAEGRAQNRRISFDWQAR